MKLLTLATTALLGISAVTANAQIDYDNLNTPFDMDYGYALVGDEGPLYDSFLVGPAATEFDGLELNINITARDEGSFYVGLYSDAGLTPGALIEKTLVSDVDILGRVQVGLGQKLLSANTEYWIGLSQNPSNPTKSAGWYFGGVPGGGDPGVQGQYWADYSGVHPNGGAFNSPFMMDLAPLPEPAPFAALGLGVLGLLLRRRRK